MRIFLLITALVAVSQAQNDCSQGACYPPISDLLLGRSHRLHASSTCGLAGSEVYCTPYLLRRMKCCPCDSRNPKGPLAHTVQDMLSTSEPDRWWQSRKEVSPVTLQLDLDNLFQLDNLLLSFKGPRPNALVIEKTHDGRTWTPAIYMAADCEKSFPDIPTTSPLTLEDTYCYTLPPTEASPYQDHAIEFSPLDQYAYVPVPKSQKIADVSGLKGMRVKLTELGDVPRLPGRALSKFYALKEMRVMGSCMCHGHADRCLPETFADQQSDTIQVNPQCDCQHHTAGVNCEHCADLYNDLPWRPAEEGETHSCKRCECNNHAESCRFDRAVYLASGMTTGGVCEECMHHTAGPKCDRCAPGYQPNPRSRMDRPDACLRCVCSVEGTVNEEQCDDTGSCQCKANVEGPRCDRCKSGYYGLEESNPLGCTKCSCSPDGSLSDACDPLTGQCPCRLHFHGLTCEVCSKGYWKPSLTQRCQPCGCDPTSSYSDTCNQVTGQCQCRPGFGGRTCTECPLNMYGDPVIGCQPCGCDMDGTLPEVCDGQTGDCLCRPGINGTRCDSCGRGHCDSFPACETCPSCFFTMDATLKNLSLALGKLSPGFPSRPGGGVDLGKFDPRIRTLKDSLKLIQDSIVLPPTIVKDIDDSVSKLDKLRDQMDKVSDDLPLSPKPNDLESELDKLQDLLDGLKVQYKAKKDATENTISPNNTGAINEIKKAYDESTDAAKKVDASEDVVKESEDNREGTIDLQNKVQPTNTRDLNKLNQTMAERPDLTPVAKQVCGSLRTKSCTPLQCEGGDLCPPEGTVTCEKGKKCVGALPLSKKAKEGSKEVKDRLKALSGKLTEATEKLQEAQDSTNQVRETAGKLSDKMKQARDELEDDLKETRDVVKDLKDFLADPASNLTHIQEVSDWILKAKLPLSVEALQKKLEELKALSENLPDSTDVLKDAAPQLEKAKKLLKEAEDARDTALGVKDNVDKLHSNLSLVDDSLGDLEDKLQHGMDIIDNLNNNLTKANDLLTPAEKALDDASKQIQPLRPQLEELKDLLEKGTKDAQDAQENADQAVDEADAAKEDLVTVEKEFEDLKNQVASSGGGDPGEMGDRLAKLQQDAGTLANTTETMMKSLEGKGDTLKELQDQFLEKSKDLEDYDAKLKELLFQLRKKAHDLSTCQG